MRALAAVSRWSSGRLTMQGQIQDFFFFFFLVTELTRMEFLSQENARCGCYLFAKGNRISFLFFINKQWFAYIHQPLPTTLLLQVKQNKTISKQTLYSNSSVPLRNAILFPLNLWAFCDHNFKPVVRSTTDSLSLSFLALILGRLSNIAHVRKDWACCFHHQ